MTVEEDLETLIDSGWTLAASLTLTTHVLLKTPSTTAGLRPPVVAAANVHGVFLPGYGHPQRYTDGADIWHYECDFIIYGVTYANIISALDDFKAICEGNTTGELLMNYPAIEGNINESFFSATVHFEWFKVVARA